MLYPQTPRPVAPYAFRNIRPFVQGGPVWSPQTRALTVFGLLECDLSYRGRSATDFMALWKFYEDVNGAAGRFTFIDFNGIAVPGGTDPGVLWEGLFVAQGDGTTTSWDAPTYHTVTGTYTITDTLWNTPLVLENGVPFTTEYDTTTPASGHYGFKPGTGTDGVDKIYAHTAPAVGVIVTVVAQCRRALRRARFTADRNPFSMQVAGNYQQGSLTIQEVRK